MNKKIDILKFLEGQADDNSIDSVNAWAKENAQDFQDYQLVWNNLDGLDEIEIDDVNEAWNEFDMLIGESSIDESSNLESSKESKNSPLKVVESNSANSNVVKQISWWKIGAVAASIFLVAALIFLNRDTIEPVLVESGNETKEFYLPDSSFVTLAPNSSVGFLNSFKKSTRRDIALIGNATFDVSKDPSKPFVVGAGKTEVKAVGTIFNVALNTQEVAVENIEGLIKFYEKGNESKAVTIKEGESYSFDGDGFKNTSIVEEIQEPVEPEPAPKPKKGIHSIREVINYMNFITNGTTKVVGKNIDFNKKISINLDTYIPEELINRISKVAKIEIKNTKKCDFCFEISSFTKK